MLLATHQGEKKGRPFTLGEEFREGGTNPTVSERVIVPKGI